MPFDRWAKLDLIQQGIWDKLIPSPKSAILGMYDQPISASPSPRQVKLHEISAYDYLKLQQESESDGWFLPPSDNGENAEAPVDAPPEVESSSMVSTTTVGSLVPGDFHRVMSTTAASKHPKTREKLTCTVHIRYTVSSFITTTSFSLIDCGSNGGVSGTDVRLISKTHPTGD
jgi:hypothetical protein